MTTSSEQNSRLLELELSCKKVELIDTQINKIVREYLYRLCVRCTKREAFRDMYYRLCLLIAEDTPETWLHQHNLPSFVENINENREYLMFLIGVSSSFMSSMVSRGIQKHTIIESAYAGVVSSDTFNRGTIISKDLLERWPLDTGVKTTLNTDSLLLTLFCIHKFCSLFSLNEFIESEQIENLLKLKNSSTNE